MKFEKVSLGQYSKDFLKDEYRRSDIVSSKIEDIRAMKYSISGFESIYGANIDDVYNDIKLPERATKNSAGYDFFAPYDISLGAGDTVRLATGIRVLLDPDKFLLCAPRSSLGFKSRMQLDNTIGIIDADYSGSSNEGHIILKITNDSHDRETLTIKKGEAIIQAIILPYYRVDDEKEITHVRDGGIGSTNK